jgi:hypothetical protein
MVEKYSMQKNIVEKYSEKSIDVSIVLYVVRLFRTRPPRLGFLASLLLARIRLLYSPTLLRIWLKNSLTHIERA